MRPSSDPQPQAPDPGSAGPEGDVSGPGRPGGAAVKSAGKVPMKRVSAGRDTEMQVLLGPEDGAPNFVLRRFRMEEGGGIPTHTNDVEHEQYVLAGRARVTVDGVPHEVERDSALFIPAGVSHSYQVLEGPFEFICVVPDAPDRIRFPDEGG